MTCLRKSNKNEIHKFGATIREPNRLQKMLKRADIKLSGTVQDINGKNTRNILEYIITGETFDEAKYDEMYKQKVIVHNLKVSKE